MAELIARTAAEGLLPRTIGAVTLAEPAMTPLATLMPLRGQSGALAGALQAAHGLALPEPGRFTSAGAVRLAWFGRQSYLLTGTMPDASLATHAAVTDQSDAWVRIILSGPGAEDVLARLVPVDLRPAAFPPGSAIRTELFHMQAAILRLSGTAVEVMTFRSMARTLIHDLASAAEGLAARHRL